MRFLARHVAIVHTPGGTLMRGKSEPTPERDSIQTLVAVRDAGGWSFASFQNTRIRPIGAGAVSALLWLVPDPIRLRLAHPPEFDLMARIAGLRLRDRWGGWNGEPYTATSWRHVSVYERATA